MCTLLFRHKPGDEYPLALLANRDEAYNRPSAGWAWRGVDRDFFAPLDEEAGGTWIGLGRSGVVVALTNIFPPAKGVDLRSRGALVADSLQLGSAVEAAENVEREVQTVRYNHFNLLLADSTSVTVLVWRKGRLKRFDLAPGAYEIRNSAFTGKLAKSQAEGENLVWLEGMRPRLKRHPHICKHGPGYGTRCSHELLLARAGVEQSRIRHLEGHPCSGKFTQVLPEESKA